MTSLLVNGLSDQHKDFLYAYAQKELGSKSRTQAILHLINEKMNAEKATIGSLNLNAIPISNKRKRVQFSLLEHEYNLLKIVAENSDTSIQYYIIRLILKDLYNKNKLLGNEIEQLKKSNYELHKIGVNINQIAKSLNSGEKVNVNLDSSIKLIKNHVDIVMHTLNKGYYDLNSGEVCENGK